MQEIVQFLLELDKLKGVTRKTRPLGLDRFENSAEHSWQLAVMAMSLGRFADAAVNVERVIWMVLLHDVGEIDVGDTIVYAEGGWEERKAAELAAVQRIFGVLPGETGARFLALWEEFEAAESADAKFAHALDRCMPVLLNLANNGQSWRENGIQFEQVVRRNGPAVQAGCPALWAYVEQRLIEKRNSGWFGIPAQPSGTSA